MSPLPTKAPQLTRVTRRPLEVRAPGKVLEGATRIVVVRDDRLGDVVLSLPAVEALRRAYPEARLALMVQPALKPLAQMVEGVDEILQASPRAGDVRRRLRDFETDTLVCISRTPSAAIAGALGRIRHRIGTGHRLYSPLFTRRVEERRSAGRRHELEFALSFAHRAGAVPGPERFGLQVPPQAEQAALGWLQSRALQHPVLLHPGSGGSCPPWPVERYLELAALLAEKGVRVIFSVGPADHACSRALDGAPGGVRDLPRTTAGLQELAALVRLSALVVSNSTGPLHLAAALGTPTLGFYAPWPTCGVARWGPYARNGWAIVAGSREARTWSRVERDRRGPSLMGTIPAEPVARRVEEILDGRLEAPRS